MTSQISGADGTINEEMSWTWTPSDESEIHVVIGFRHSIWPNLGNEKILNNSTLWHFALKFSVINVRRAEMHPTAAGPSRAVVVR